MSNSHPRGLILSNLNRNNTHIFNLQRHYFCRMTSALHTLIHKRIHADRLIREFSVLGFCYPRFTAARKKNRKIEEINGP